MAVNDQVKMALKIDGRDNIAVAMTDLQKGDICVIRQDTDDEKIEVMEDVPFGHKIATCAIGMNESVYKYGEEIGKMAVSVQKGGWVHTHNLYCERGMKYGR